MHSKAASNLQFLMITLQLVVLTDAEEVWWLNVVSPVSVNIRTVYDIIISKVSVLIVSTIHTTPIPG
jgi:hypothetical protein